MSPSTPSKTLDSSLLDHSTSWIDESLADDSGVNSSLWLGGGYSTPPGLKWGSGSGGKSSGKENSWGVGGLMGSPVVGTSGNAFKRKCNASKRIAFSPLKIFGQMEGVGGGCSSQQQQVSSSMSYHN